MLSGLRPSVLHPWSLRRARVLYPSHMIQTRTIGCLRHYRGEGIDNLVDWASFNGKHVALILRLFLGLLLLHHRAGTTVQEQIINIDNVILLLLL